MARRFRIFISSPGDVGRERLRADLVIDKLAQEYRRQFRIEPYRWEHEPLLASCHFQDAIDPPSEADVVVLILWSRLGTPLPAQTALREYKGADGRVPVTGTEWEFEDALVAARARGTPDILVFRNLSPALIDSSDAAKRAASVSQLEALEKFWKRNFDDSGAFISAFDQYRTLDEFARRLEQSLRKLIERRAAGHGAAPAEPLWSGSPFRGLSAYEFEHADIFFGRDGMIARAADQLAARALAGCAFLLMAGSSGSGKSSLAKAGLIPRLMKPQRIEGVAVLRRAIFVPGDMPDLVQGLIECLTKAGSSVDIGLPELLAPGQTADNLAALLRRDPQSAGFVFANALGRVTAEAQASGRILPFENAHLILLVDQFEELFSPARSAEDRRIFVRVLEQIARSAVVWVVATMRADFWHHAIELPELAALIEGEGHIDIATASPAELGEIIRKPAAAAGLSFEINDVTGIGLDAILAEHAAAEPGSLPLLSFVLDLLFEADVEKAGRHVLTYASYDTLGGFNGAIARRADQVLEAQPPDVLATFPNVLRALTTLGAEDTVVARTVALSRFPAGSHARALVDALTGARLVATVPGIVPSVRLAHESLMRHWERARQQLLLDRRDLETRNRLEEEYRRWSDAWTSRQLLLRDPDLANARDLIARWGSDIAPELSAYVARSASHAKLRQSAGWFAAGAFGLVAATATVLGVSAHQLERRAQLNFKVAEKVSGDMAYEVARFLDSSSAPPAAVSEMLRKLQQHVDMLVYLNPSDEELVSVRAMTLLDMEEAEFSAGNLDAARSSATHAVTGLRAYLAHAPDDVRVRNMLAISLLTLGNVERSQRKFAQARASYTDALFIATTLPSSVPGRSKLVADLERLRALLPGRGEGGSR